MFSILLIAIIKNVEFSIINERIFFPRYVFLDIRFYKLIPITNQENILRQTHYFVNFLTRKFRHCVGIGKILRTAT